MLDPDQYPAPEDFDLDAALGLIRRAMPGLALNDPRVLGNGFDNIALLVGGMIFRFPRSLAGEARLRKEAGFLALIRPRIDMVLPDLVLHEDPSVFSCHRFIPGEVFTPDKYLTLSEIKREQMAEQLAVLYAQLHAIPVAEVQSAGAVRVDDFCDTEKMLVTLETVLTADECRWAQQVVAAWRNLPPDPLGNVFGWFDGHGWNMAIDFDRGQINGVFDFADAGLGSVHNDLMHNNLMHPDLTERIIRRYNARTGQQVDPQRIALISSMHRLSDMAESHDHPVFGELTYYLLRRWRKHPQATSAPMTFPQ